MLPLNTFTVFYNSLYNFFLNPLNLTGHVMHHSTFNNCTFCPHCIYVFCIYLRTNSDLCHLRHKLIGFYKRDEKCLLHGTNWVFKVVLLAWCNHPVSCRWITTKKFFNMPALLFKFTPTCSRNYDV